MATNDGRGRSRGSGDWTFEDHAESLQDMRLESVDDHGLVTIRFPGNWTVRFSVSRELAPTYRRLIEAA